MIAEFFEAGPCLDNSFIEDAAVLSQMQPRLSARAFSGMRRVRGTRMLVSKGIGASRIPLRVGVRPEIDLMLF